MNSFGFSTRRVARPDSSRIATPNLGRVVHLVEQDLGVGVGIAESVDEADDAAAQEVVAQEDDEGTATDEVLARS